MLLSVKKLRTGEAICCTMASGILWAPVYIINNMKSALRLHDLLGETYTRITCLYPDLTWMCWPRGGVTHLHQIIAYLLCGSEIIVTMQNVSLSASCQSRYWTQYCQPVYLYLMWRWNEMKFEYKKVDGVKFRNWWSPIHTPKILTLSVMVTTPPKPIFELEIAS